MKHPPLCPKTQENFQYDWFGGVCVEINRSYAIDHHDYVRSMHPDGRRFIARYQACAWQDRAARWSELWANSLGRRSEAYWNMYNECWENVAKWRKWERQGRHGGEE